MTTDGYDTSRNGERTEDGGMNADIRQFLTFTVGEEEYGVDIMAVREIKGWSSTTRLPNTPEYMRGVMNLRGLIIPIFDLRCRFGGGLTDANAKNVVIILAVGAKNIGVLVDTVSDILDVSGNEIKSSPQTETNIDKAYVKGLISKDGRMPVLLDMEKLFGDDAENVQDSAAKEGYAESRAAASTS